MTDLKKNTTSIRYKLIDILAAVLLMFFVHTIISTYVQLQSLKNMLAFYTIHTSAVAWTVLICEVIIACCLFIKKVRFAGLLMAAIFGVGGMAAIYSWPHFPHDFGGIVNDISTPSKYMVYGIVAFLGCLGIVISLLPINKSLKHPEPVANF